MTRLEDYVSLLTGPCVHMKDPTSPRPCRECVTTIVRLAMGAALSVEGEASTPTPSPAPGPFAHAVPAPGTPICGAVRPNDPWPCNREPGHAFAHQHATQWSVSSWIGAGSPPSPSPSGEAMTDEEAARRLKAAHEMVSALCKPRGSSGSREWIMRIPAEPDYDPDLVIAAGLHAGDVLLAERSSLRGEEIDVNCECTDEAPYVCPKHHPETLWREYQRLSQENSALRTRAEKAEAELHDWPQRYDDAVQPLQRRARDYIIRAEKAEADLASAREALRMIASLPGDVGDFNREAVAIATACFSGAPPAPAPAPPACGICNRPMTPITGRADAYECRGAAGDHYCTDEPDEPVAQEDAPVPEKPHVHTYECANTDCEAVVGPAAEPSPDLEGLIRDETHAQMNPPPSGIGYREYCESRLRSFASEVSRRVREPLEKACEEAGKLADSLAADVSEAERKLSEVTQEREADAYEAYKAEKGKA